MSGASWIDLRIRALWIHQTLSNDIKSRYNNHASPRNNASSDWSHLLKQRQIQSFRNACKQQGRSRAIHHIDGNGLPERAHFLFEFVGLPSLKLPCINNLLKKCLTHGLTCQQEGLNSGNPNWASAAAPSVTCSSAYARTAHLQRYCRYSIGTSAAAADASSKSSISCSNLDELHRTGKAMHCTGKAQVLTIVIRTIRTILIEQLMVVDPAIKERDVCSCITCPRLRSALSHLQDPRHEAKIALALRPCGPSSTLILNCWHQRMMDEAIWLVVNTELCY